MFSQKLMFVFALASVAAFEARAQEFDSFYRDILVALTHQCSTSYPDLKPVIDNSVHNYATINAHVLSRGYEEHMRGLAPDARVYSREQCLGMSKLPEKPMDEMLRQYGKELQQSEKRRADFERSQK